MATNQSTIEFISTNYLNSELKFNANKESLLFFLSIYLSILDREICTTHTRTVFEGRGESNLYQLGGTDFFAPLGQMPSGHVFGVIWLFLSQTLVIKFKIKVLFSSLNFAYNSFFVPEL